MNAAQAVPATPQGGASPDVAATPQGAGQDQDESQALTVIEVTVNADGTITVEQESGSQEAGEESGTAPGAGEQPEAPGTSVKNSSEAASLVKQMIDQATQTTPQQNMQNKAEQTAGYQGV